MLADRIHKNFVAYIEEAKEDLKDRHDIELIEDLIPAIMLLGLLATCAFTSAILYIIMLLIPGSHIPYHICFSVFTTLKFLNIFLFGPGKEKEKNSGKD